MQKVTHWIALVCANFLLISALSASGTPGTITFVPAKPHIGEQVKINYNAKGSDLEGESKLKALVYHLKEGLPEVKEIELGFSGDYYFGSFEVEEGVKSVLIKFCDVSEETFDDNAGFGFVSPVYDANSKPIKGAYASIANAYNNYGRVLKIEASPAKANKYYEKEFKYYPEQKEDLSTYLAYMRTFDESKKEEAKVTMKEIADKLLAAESFNSEADVNAGLGIARLLNDKDLAEKLSEKAKKQFPMGNVAIGDKVNAFYQARDLATAEPIFNKYGELPEHDSKEGNMANMAGRLATLALNADNMDAFEKYFKMIQSNNRKASILNNIAWGYSGESIDAEAPKLADGLKFSAKSLKYLDMAMKEKESTYATQKEWEDQLGYSYGMYADTYALLLYKNGQRNEALKYQTIAVDKLGKNDVSITERYARFEEEVNGPAKALSFLQEAMEEGSISPKMSTQFERLYKAHKSIDEAFADYMALIKKQKAMKAKEELSKELIDQDPIPFALNDMDGNPVNLEDYKGKIVILDFWATWCGPCKASFPGMQAAIDKYVDQEDVAFLFIDTWENGEDKAANAKKFITKNEYTFNVLMDDKNEVVAKYGVNGIPTKFILDGDHRIRFKKVGGDADVDKLVTEITAMIDILREE